MFNEFNSISLGMPILKKAIWSRCVKNCLQCNVYDVDTILNAHVYPKNSLNRLCLRTIPQFKFEIEHILLSNGIFLRRTSGKIHLTIISIYPVHPQSGCRQNILASQYLTDWQVAGRWCLLYDRNYDSGQVQCTTIDLYFCSASHLLKPGRKSPFGVRYDTEGWTIWLELRVCWEYDREFWLVECTNKREPAWAARTNRQLFELIRLTGKYRFG